MVAAFVGMRLYAVLGKRTGHEQPLPRPAEDRQHMPGTPVARADNGDAAAPVAEKPQTPGAEAGLRAISVADRSFSAADFIDGAKSAYRLILEAFWAGNEAGYTRYVGDGVREAFAESTAQRTTDGHVLDNRLVAIERTMITDARLESRVATITVNFVADIAAVTRDAEGKVIAGSLTDAVPSDDKWTFTRDLASKDPNWILTDTD
jgi:predicted lipid-binding transport protein (Tim44 family)